MIPEMELQSPTILTLRNGIKDSLTGNALQEHNKTGEKEANIFSV